MIPKSKLIIVEGIPGSGKSTNCRKIVEYLKQYNYNIKHYRERYYHPADLSRLSYMSIDTFNCLKEKYKSNENQIINKTVFEDDFAITAFTKIEAQKDSFYEDFKKHQVYETGKPLEHYTSIHIKRWSNFAQNALKSDVIHVFECALIQNPLVELMFERNCELTTIVNYILKLYETIKCLNPILIYVDSKDVNETVERAKQERIARNGKMAWYDEAETKLKQSAYGKQVILDGKDIVTAILENRKKIDMQILKNINGTVSIIDNSPADWENSFLNIKNVLDSILY